LAQRGQARADLPAVEQHRASAAIACVAADLGAGEAKLVAQHVGKPGDRARAAGYLRPLTVKAIVLGEKFGARDDSCEAFQRPADQRKRGFLAVSRARADVVDWREVLNVPGKHAVTQIAVEAAPASACSSFGKRRATGEQDPTAIRAARTVPSSTSSTHATIAMEMTRYLRAPSFRKSLRAGARAWARTPR
jgi:hypothetical protein